MIGAAAGSSRATGASLKSVDQYSDAQRDGFGSLLTRSWCRVRSCSRRAGMRSHARRPDESLLGKAWSRFAELSKIA